MSLSPCPCCGRPVSPSQLRDVSGIPEAYRGPLAVVCDQRAALWHHTGQLRYAEQARFSGMPAAVVTKLAAKHRDAPPPARAALAARLATRLAGRMLRGADRVAKRQAQERQARERRAEWAATRPARPERPPRATPRRSA